MLTPAEQQDLAHTYEQSYKYFSKMVSKKLGGINTINISKNLHDEIDKLVSSIKAKGVQFGCKKGCSLCCNIRVEALAPEVFYIARVLKSKLPKDELRSTIDRLHDHSIKARGIPIEKYDISCPLLKDDICSIYEIRPAMCRKYNSLDLNACQSIESDIPENVELSVRTGAIGKGFRDAFVKKNLLAEPHELGQALYLALTDPTAENRWKQKETVFATLPEMSKL